jgi:4-amino-4-deoxy-L-arabinose transferase-like glycosyltransferase
MKSALHNLLSWLKRNDRGEKITAVIVLALAGFLLFYNLDLNPRPWQDDGFAPGIAKSLVQTGVYAIQVADGYQTYGGVQSAGPTIVLPIALAYRLLGVGLVQSRLVMALFAFITLVLFYLSGQAMFNRRVAILAVILVLGSQSVGYFVFGRPAFGEVPALGFFLAGWLIWSQAVRRRRAWLVPVAGVLFGLAMVTKSYYLVIAGGTIAALVILDRFFYHQHCFRYLFVLGITAVACYALWQGWQWNYFGADVFTQNLGKLRQLADASVGFNLTWIGDAIKQMIGPGAGYFYFYWGFLALLYAVPLIFRRTRDSFLLAFVGLFAIFWLGYSTFGRLPIPRYILPGTALAALFVILLKAWLLQAATCGRR